MSYRARFAAKSGRQLVGDVLQEWRKYRGIFAVQVRISDHWALLYENSMKSLVS
jgi:hypothetical protein